MNKLLIYILISFFLFGINIKANENFFEIAKKKYDNQKIDESKFLFQRNIVYNPKHSESYLYLAKIYNKEKNQKEELKNLKTTLLLKPNNEEALFMLIDLELDKSNISEVKKLLEDFNLICSTMCKEGIIINKKLTDIEAKNASKK